MSSFCCWHVSGLDVLGVSSWPQILLVGQCLSLSRQKAERLLSKPLRTLKYSHSGSMRMAMPNEAVVSKLTHCPGQVPSGYRTLTLRIVSVVLTSVVFGYLAMAVGSALRLSVECAVQLMPRGASRMEPLFS